MVGVWREVGVCRGVEVDVEGVRVWREWGSTRLSKHPQLSMSQ